jgi:hypothetical protein
MLKALKLIERRKLSLEIYPIIDRLHLVPIPQIGPTKIITIYHALVPAFTEAYRIAASTPDLVDLFTFVAALLKHYR